MEPEVSASGPPVAKPQTYWLMRKVAPHDPAFVEHVQLYDEAPTAVGHTFRDGLTRRTVFVHSEPGRNRLVRKCTWEDVTHMYTADELEVMHERFSSGKHPLLPDWSQHEPPTADTAPPATEPEAIEEPPLLVESTSGRGRKRA